MGIYINRGGTAHRLGWTLVSFVDSFSKYFSSYFYVPETGLGENKAVICPLLSWRSEPSERDSASQKNYMEN